MKTINDILRGGDGLLGNWGLWANDVVASLDKLRATPKRAIAVNTVQVPSQDITVRVFEDGLLSYCNHAGAYIGSVTQYAGLDDEGEAVALLCDKCIAVGDIREGFCYV